jgi:hypothetical protein
MKNYGITIISVITSFVAQTRTKEYYGITIISVITSFVAQTRTGEHSIWY